MSKYRGAAVYAVEALADGRCKSPEDAWEKATKQFFPTSANLQNKGCPKGAFLGLCSKGLVKGVSEGTRSKISKNGDYAVEAVEILRSNKFLASQPNLLWKKIAGTKSHNHQLDVVLGLWDAGLIE